MGKRWSFEWEVSFKKKIQWERREGLGVRATAFVGLVPGSLGHRWFMVFAEQRESDFDRL